MSCSCSGSSKVASGRHPAGSGHGLGQAGGLGGEGAGVAFEPFPRQMLMGGPAAAFVYYSETFDVTQWKSLVYWLQVDVVVPPPPFGLPVYANIEESNSLEGPWTDILPVDLNEGMGGIASAVATPSARFIRAWISIDSGYTAMVAFRLVARPC